MCQRGSVRPPCCQENTKSSTCKVVTWDSALIVQVEICLIPHFQKNPWESFEKSEHIKHLKQNKFSRLNSWESGASKVDKPNASHTLFTMRFCSRGSRGLGLQSAQRPSETTHFSNKNKECVKSKVFSSSKSVASCLHRHPGVQSSVLCSGLAMPHPQNKQKLRVQLRCASEKGRETTTSDEKSPKVTTKLRFGNLWNWSSTPISNLCQQKR